jgi:hypothetical protein
MTEPDFSVAIYQNEYLPEGGQDVNAIVTVTSPADGPPAGASQDGAAEVIIIDCSGSMGAPRSKIEQAKLATGAAIDVIRDGVAFAVIAGTDTARSVFPVGGGLVGASPQTRAEAKRAVAELRPNGGTAIGRWLTLAKTMFEQSPAAIRHAILLTDGKNEHESPGDLDAAIASCDGKFSCDCRGVGTDWVVAELRRVAAGLLGTVDIVPEPEGLSADFAAMMEKAMGKQVPDVMLRVWTPQHAQLTFVKQVSPSLEDLTSRRSQSGPQSGDYPTGAWGAGESRDYHVCVHVGPAEVGQEMLAARVSLVVGSQVAGQGLVRAVWTSDIALSTRINSEVAHYTDQSELAESIQDGLEARRRGDEDTATAKLGRAVQLAHQSGNDQAAGLLAKVVDVLDPATGTVKVKKTVATVDEMTLDTRSTVTVRKK